MNRRQVLAVGTLAGVATVLPASQAKGKRLGLTIASYGIRWRKRKALKRDEPGWRNALDVLDHCQDLGAGCLQIGVGGWTHDFSGQVRDKRESLGIELEGQIGLPKEDGELERFEKGIIAAKEAGADIVRTACLGQRRYEVFTTLEDWEQFVSNSRKALERAEPVLAKHQVKLAVENHKDWRIDEHLDLLKHIESEWIGVNLDFGNNFALLEDPHLVAETLAPYVMTTHIKDMALAEYEEGFLLSEVPLGEGVLDLRHMMDLCEAKNSNVQFNLEMITRDPLKIPVLEDQYWATFGLVAASHLVNTLKVARKGDISKLTSISGRDDADLVSYEEANVRRSFEYAGSKLGL